MTAPAPLALVLVLACSSSSPPAPDAAPYRTALDAWLDDDGFEAPDAAAALAVADPGARALPLLVARLTARDWSLVHRAQEALVAYGDRAVPALVTLLDDDRFEKLEGTMDLIYPGAEETYGHGYLLEYDVDPIPVRAGWALEEITGRAFGFVDEDQGWPGASSAEERAGRWREAVARSKTWWAARPR